MTQNDLLRGLREALRAELNSGVQALRFMAEIERRKLYVERGFSSLFRFCVEGIGLTEDQACRRVAVVRAARRVPEVFELLATGQLHMTGVAKLAKFMNDDNAHSLIEQAKNKSKAEVEMLIATEFPGAKSSDDRVEAATAETFAFHFDGSAEAKALLDRAKELTPPGTDIGEIFEAALSLYVEKLESRKNGKTSRPRSKPSEDAPAGAAYVPAATRRAVVERDGAQCTYVSPDGRRCSERSNLEFDHVGGRALGPRAWSGSSACCVARTTFTRRAKCWVAPSSIGGFTSAALPSPGKTRVPSARGVKRIRRRRHARRAARESDAKRCSRPRPSFGALRSAASRLHQPGETADEERVAPRRRRAALRRGAPRRLMGCSRHVRPPSERHWH